MEFSVVIKITLLAAILFVLLAPGIVLTINSTSDITWFSEKFNLSAVGIHLILFSITFFLILYLVPWFSTEGFSTGPKAE